MLYSLLFNHVRNTRNPTKNRANIYDTADQYIIHIEAPGFTKDELKIEIDDKILSVTAEKETAIPEGFRGKQPSKRSLNRQFQFYKDIDPAQTHASLNNGLLQISLQKTKRQSIPVTVA